MEALLSGVQKKKDEELGEEFSASFSSSFRHTK